MIHKITFLKTIGFFVLSFFTIQAAHAQYIWHQVGTNFTTGVASVSHVASATEIYAAGDFGVSSSPTTTGKVMKWNGTTWAALGTFSTIRGFNTMRYVASNNIYVAGYEGNASSLNQVMRWNGTAWAAVGALNANSDINVVDYISTSEVYAAGYFTEVGGNRYVAKWNGTTWSKLGTFSPTNAILALKCVSSTELYAAGDQTSSGFRALNKWNGTTWSRVGNPFVNDTGADGDIYTINYVSANEIYVAGTIKDFTGGTTRLKILKWNGTVWSAVGTFPISQNGNLNISIREIAYKSANEIYVIGNLDYSSTSPDPESAYKWDGTTWTKVLPTPFISYAQTMKYHAATNTFYATGSNDIAAPFNSSAMYRYAPCVSATTPTVTANRTNVCSMQAVTLTASGTLNDETNWVWYSGSCGGTQVGTGASITINPTVTATYYVRGEGSCNTPGACGSITVTVSPDPRIYVKVNATGLNNGTSWANAYTSLQAALDQTTVCDSIFVAAGTYIPTKDAAGSAAPANVRTKTFKIPSGVKVFGGFAGTETQLAQRNTATNPTILSGDIGTLNSTTDNAFHVVSFINAANTTEINGFIIEKGNANSTAASNFDKGAGIFNNGSGAGGSSNPNIYNCTLRNNTATGIGGGMLDYGPNGGSVNSNLLNCTFNNNIAITGGGYHGLSTATTAGSCSATLTNCLFYSNTATNDGGGVYINNPVGNVILYYCTFTNNTVGASKKGKGAFLLAGTLSLYSSISYHGIAQNEVDKTAGSLSFSQVLMGVDPLFVNTAVNDYHLQACSPAINAESRTFSSDPITDLDGNPRAYNGGNKDLGCYERQASNGGKRIYVSPSAYLGANNGTSWANAYTTLQAALDVACMDTIWVVRGTFYPNKDEMGNATPTDNRTKTFRIPNGTVLYGGFLGTETSLSQRPNTLTATVKTTLSGDIGAQNDHSDDAYHAVTLRDNNSTTSIDGVSIVYGNANGLSSSNYDKGAGIYSYTTLASLSHDPLLQNVIISNNTAVNGGGIFENNLISSASSVRYYNCIVKNNTATANGGGIYINGATGSTMSYLGGCLIHGNTATGNGGGLYLIGAAGMGLSVQATNVTFAKNTAVNGQAIFANEPTSGNVYMAIYQSILWNNIGSSAQAISGTNASFSPSYSMIQNYSATQSTAVANGLTLFTNSVLQTYPDFQNIAADNFELEYCSPATNAGSATHFLATDAKGSTRVFGNHVDYGALELQRTNPTIPTVSIAADQTSICSNVSVTFTATPIDGGSSPSYQWKKNGTNVGTNSPVYTTNGLANNDVINCQMTSNIGCLSPNLPVNSNNITIQTITVPSVLYIDSTATNGGNGSSWATAMNSLSDAILLAYQCNNVDTLKVAKGTYLPIYPYIKNSTLRPIALADVPAVGGQTSAQTYEYLKSFHLRSGLKLLGGYPSGGGTRNSAINPTILSGNIGSPISAGDNTCHVVTVIGGNSQVLMDGFTIRDGYSSNQFTFSINGHITWTTYGSGLAIFGQSNIWVKNMTFLKNVSGYNGGGMSCDSSTFLVEKSVFQQNTAYGGGGFSTTTSTGTVSNSLFKSNTSTGNAAGLISLGKSQILVTNCDFISNIVTHPLGGGGGLYGSIYSRNIIDNCVFNLNSAGRGGGVYGSGDTCLIRNSLFTYNNSTATSTYSGGSAIGHESTVGAPIQITNCTVFGNTSTVSAKGAVANNAGTMNILNCIIRNNGTNIFHGGVSFSINYSNIEGGYAGTGNTTTDPSFLNTADIDGPDNTWRTDDDGFRLQAGSTAANVGNNTNAPTTDILGANRIGVVDMGAYESGVCIGAPTAYTVTGGGSYCTGSNTTIGLSGSQTGISYQLKLNGSNTGSPIIGTGSSIDFGTITSPGTYTVLATNTYTSCTSLMLNSNVVSINPLPTGATSGDASICDGEPLPDVTFTFTGTPPFNFTYTINGSATSITGLNDYYYTLSAATAATYSLSSLSDANTCSATDLGLPSVVTVNPLPTASVSGGGASCPSDPLPDVTFTFTGTPPFDFTYEVDGNNTTVITGHNSYTYTFTPTIAGNYNLTQLFSTSTNCGATDLGSFVSATHYPDLVGVISGGGAGCSGGTNTISFNFGGTPPFTFSYLYNSNTITVTNHNSYSYNLSNPSGSYQLTALSDPNGCTATLLGGTITANFSQTLSRIYVNAAATGANNGTSWADAFTDLQAALNYPCRAANAEIWVATGVYTPTSGSDRNAAFNIPSGVKLYGGFLGTETATTQRLATFTNPTTLEGSILSGNIGNTSSTADNSYHVVKVNQPTVATRLDGFTISDGYADGSYPQNVGAGVYDFKSQAFLTLTNCILTNNFADEGAALYNYGVGYNCNPIISNCIFTNNTAGNLGGAIENYGDNVNSNPSITNCVFANNTAVLGGAIYNASFDPGVANPTILNCTFYNNTASTYGGGIYSYNEYGTATPIIKNTLFLQSTIVSHSGSLPTFTTSNNNAVDPLFINTADLDGTDNIWRTADDGLQLSCGSPALNTGTNTGAPATDIVGTARPQFTTTDMGAYESLGTFTSISPVISGTTTSCNSVSLTASGGDTYLWSGGNTPNSDANSFSTSGIYTVTVSNTSGCSATASTTITVLPTLSRAYVNGAVTASGDGSTWATAFKTVQEGLDACGVTEVWVANGTYYPTTDPFGNSSPSNNRDKTFYIKDGISLYGGFVGTEAAIGDRPAFVGNSGTILSGDIGTLNDDTDNAYHVVMVLNQVALNTSTINGFTIKKGRTAPVNDNTFITVDGLDMYRNRGAGMVVQEASPMLSMLLFTENTAYGSGGGLCNLWASPYLSSVSFTNNSGYFGGGMYAQYRAIPIIDNCLFSNNTANYGGGVYITNTGSFNYSALTNTQIIGNNAAIRGGGVYNDHALMTIDNSTTTGNSSVDAGGIYNAYGNLAISNSVISNNTATTCGGINAFSGVFALTNCVLSENTASDKYGGILVDFANSTIKNTTIANNTATNTGAGVANNSNNSNFSNCIIWGNTGAGTTGILNLGNTAAATYSIVEGSPIYTGTGNLNSNPNFANSSDPDGADNIWRTADDGLRLSCGSAAFNTGTNTGAPATDILGNPMFGATKDMGAYESQTGLNSVTATITGTTTLCAGATATLTASGGNTYLWNTGATTAAITTTSAGIYTVTATNTAGCTISTSVAVTINTAPTAAITITGTTCPKTLTASGGGTYLWNTGATTAAISSSATSAAIYTVTVTGTNGCTATATASVDCCNLQITEMRYITYSYVTTAVFPTPTVTGCSAGSTLSYLWEFGDGTTSTAASPTRTYAAQGIYNVCLTVTCTNADGTFCRAKCCREVNIGKTCGTLFPTFAYSTGSATGSTMSFTGTVQSSSIIPAPISTYEIYNSTNTFIQSITGTNISYTFPNSGEYTVCRNLTTQGDATYGAYCSSKNCRKITVVSATGCPAIVRFTATVYKANVLNVTFNASSYCTGVNTYYWEYSTSPTGTFTQLGSATNAALANPAFVFPSAGIYWVRLTGNKGTSCETRTTARVNLNGFTCSSATLPGAPNMQPSNSEEAVEVGNSNTDEMNVNSEAASTATTNALPTCGNFAISEMRYITYSSISSVVFPSPSLSNIPASSVLSYLWEFGDGTSSNVVNPTRNYAAPGVYNVCLTVNATQADGVCQAKCCRTVNVSKGCAALSPTFAYASAAVGLAHSFTGTLQSNTIVPAPISTYEIYNNTNTLISTVAGTDVNYTFPNSGEYTVCRLLTTYADATSGGYCDNKNCRKITVMPTAGCNTIVRFIATVYKSNALNVTFNASSYSTGVSSYYWEYSTSPTGTFTQLGSATNAALGTPAFIFPSAGIYWIRLTANKGTVCESTVMTRIKLNGFTCTNSSSVTLTTSNSRNTEPEAAIEVGNSTINTGIALYPNPTEGQVTITFGNDIKATTLINVYTMNGQLVTSFRTQEGDNQTTIDLSEQPNGIYLFHIENESSERLVKKIMVQR